MGVTVGEKLADVDGDTLIVGVTVALREEVAEGEVEGE